MKKGESTKAAIQFVNLENNFFFLSIPLNSVLLFPFLPVIPGITIFLEFTQRKKIRGGGVGGGRRDYSLGFFS